MGDRVDSVKAQDQNGSVYICVSSEIAEDLGIEPGDDVRVREQSDSDRGIFGRDLDSVADD